MRKFDFLSISLDGFKPRPADGEHMPVAKYTKSQVNALWNGRVEILSQLKKEVKCLDFFGWFICAGIFGMKNWGILDGDIGIEEIGNEKIVGRGGRSSERLQSSYIA